MHALVALVFELLALPAFAIGWAARQRARGVAGVTARRSRLLGRGFLSIGVCTALTGLAFVFAPEQWLLFISIGFAAVVNLLILALLIGLRKSEPGAR